ncbi:MAG: hypothetical protein ABIP02_01605 [Arenimonas sp.]
MNDNVRTTLKVIAVFLVGFSLNVAITVCAAPGYPGTALLIGIFLTAFGFIFAKFVMELVVLPMAAISIVLRLVRGKKIIPKSKPKNDKFDFFGRVLFVLTYGFVSAFTGIFIGAKDGGLSWVTTSAVFGTLGILYAMLFPQDLIWAMEGGDSLLGEPTAAGRADIEQARKDGNSSVLFADKIAKNVFEVILEKPDPKV